MVLCNKNSYPNKLKVYFKRYVIENVNHIYVWNECYSISFPGFQPNWCSWVGLEMPQLRAF